jgi:hypothetical protein
MKGVGMMSNKATGKTTMPANEQKGKKTCTCCHEEKKVTDFYISKSPLFSIDERVPVCKTCVINSSINEDGTVNELELNRILRKIDKPYYKDLLESSKNRFIKEHSYVEENDVKFFGKEILQAYFTLVAMRQDRDKSYDDSEKDGFVHITSNTSKSTKQKIAKKYADINESNYTEEFDIESQDVIWSEKDKQNMSYVISTIGYDPFNDVGLKDVDKKYCFNILAGYCDTDGISEDGHKMQSVIEMTMLYCQCRKITETMNVELSSGDVDDTKISKLTSSKTALLSSIATIAKDNNIASNYNKNSKQGQSSLTSKMKEMAENDFEAIKVNLFDIKTSEAFKQIADLSNQSIMDQLTFDNNDYVEIIKEQREIIQKYETDFDELKEENRNLKNKITDLENWKR